MFTIICSTNADAIIVLHILASVISVSFAVTILSVAIRGLQLMSNVVIRCVCLIVCVTLGPKAVISRGDKIATANGGVHFLRRFTAYEVYGGLRRLTVAVRVSSLSASPSRAFHFLDAGKP